MGSSPDTLTRALIAPADKNAAFTTALRDGRTAYGWDEVEALTARLAAGIAASVTGVQRVGIFARNAAETALAYVAGLRAGVSPVPINFHLTPGECAYILRDADIGLLLVGPETAAAGLAAAAEAGVRAVAGWRCDDVAGIIDWMALPTANGDRLAAPARPYLHYTSGTTGRPKGAETPPNMFPQVETVGQLFAAYRDAVEALPAGPSLIVGPMYHTGPLNSVRHLAGGKPLIVRERFDAEEMLATVAAARVSTVTLVPTHFQRLLGLPNEVRARYDVSSLKAVNHTGAACPPEVKRRMIDWIGPVLTESYGATEIGSVTAITAPEWLERPGSVGRAQPGFAVVVLSDDGRELGANETGQLYFRDLSGRGIIYHNAPNKTAAAHIAPGVLTLGDIGHVDDAGYVFITDRQVDMIVSGGVNIYPAEIEAALALHPAVEDSAVIGVPDAEMGESVKALVVLRAGETASVGDLLAHCRKHLAGYKCPRSIDLVETVGRNPMGKVSKRDLRAPFWPTGRTIGG